MTEGVGDPLRGGGLRGWAGRLADGLRGVERELFHANLAHRGWTTKQIRDGQLEAALELRPDLTSIITGMNDAIRRDFDPDEVGALLEEMVGALAGAGATVLMGTLPDVTRVMLMPGRLTRAFSERLEALNEIVRDVAARHGEATVLVDAADYPDELTRRNWSLDMLHPNSAAT